VVPEVPHGPRQAGDNHVQLNSTARGKEVPHVREACACPLWVFHSRAARFPAGRTELCLTRRG
jgi:hypothetical protein